MTRVKGKDVLLYAGVDIGEPEILGMSTSCDMTVTVDIKEFTSFLSGRAKRTRPGRYSWQVNTELIVADGDAARTTLLQSATIGRLLKLRMTLGDTMAYGNTIQGNVYVGSFRLTGALGDMARCSVTLIGDGPLKLE